MIEISRTCSNVEIVMGELKIVAHNLRVMKMEDIDIILELDWMTTNFATIRCKERYKLQGRNPPYTTESR